MFAAEDIEDVEDDAELEAIMRNSLYGLAAFGLDSGDILRFGLRRW